MTDDTVERDAQAAAYDGISTNLKSEPCAFKRQCFRDGWDAALAAMPQQEVTVKDAAKVLLASCPNPIFDNLKYDLIGEFSQTECYVNDDGDEDSMIVTVEWCTMKEIITAALSALSGQDAEGDT